METYQLGGIKAPVKNEPALIKSIDLELVLPNTTSTNETCNCIKAPCSCGDGPIKTAVSQAVSGVKELSTKVVEDAKKERVQKVLLLLGAGLLVYAIVKK
jgi:hypothetical protein